MATGVPKTVMMIGIASGDAMRSRDTVAAMLRQATLLLFMSAPVLAAGIDQLLQEGAQRFEAGDLDGALAAFDKAERLAPKDARPYYMRGSALAKKGDATGAEKSFREALALDATLVEVRAELGALLVDRRRYADAEKELKAAVKGKPDLTEAWYNLGQTELALKQCAPALDAYKRVTQIQPGDADGWINLSVAQRKCKADSDALASARQAVKTANPKETTQAAAAQLNLGLTLQGAGKLDDAAAAMGEATRLRPDYATAWWSLGLLERERKRLDPAVNALERAYKLQPQNPVRATDLGVALRDQGSALHDQGRLDRAVELFKAALARDPRYAPARWHLAQTLAASGKCKEALTEIDKLPPAEAKSEAADKLRARCAK
jgi:tetratricopeptide (TPR) repeat protein